jgi:hypothetical protein
MSSFEDWLLDERNKRTVLVELQAYQPTTDTVVAYYISNTGFTSRSTDTPANTAYPPYLRKIPEIESSLDEPMGVGSIEIRNPGGVLDAAIRNSFGLRPAKIYLGDPSWSKAAFYECVFTINENGVTSNSPDNLSVQFKDPVSLLDVPIITDIISNDAKDLIPLGVGKVFNLSPVFVSKTITSVYRFNEGAVISVTDVRDGGVTTDPGNYTLDIGAGTITFSVFPASDITMDIIFTSVTSVVELVKGIIEDAILKLTLTLTYDSTNFNIWITALPYDAGDYYTEKTTYLEAIENLLSSVGLKISGFPTGELYLWRITRPLVPTDPTTGDIPVFTANISNIAQNGLSVSRTVPVLDKIKLGYKKNFTEQNKDNLYGAVDPDLVELYSSRQSSVFIKNTPALTDKYLSAKEFPGEETGITETLLYNQANAATEANRRLSLYNQEIQGFEVKLTQDFIQRLGSIIWLEYPRYGFNSGRKVQVVGVSWDISTRSSILTVYDWQDLV